ncbi:hypothetical protein BKP37_10975 [Anaerobacillus alkalilacustris]|uniref:Uncharacterized protein n=1 Tax=Anaerobacillus alkalilacustris TaxID=393763 RepID=A0A1S2LKX0_9BACI|nr:HD domain-containing phosphohydrolase [Anaerobacillus alkalilacustris]OIJ13036.1 hypothetical protein BKP37_10975 [Anaerobacillus alkalilacustris]
MLKFTYKNVPYIKNSLVLIGASAFILFVFWFLLYLYIFPTIKETAHNSINTQLQIIKQDTLEDLDFAKTSLERLAGRLSLINIHQELRLESIGNISDITPVFDQVTILDRDLNIVYQKPEYSSLVQEGNDKQILNRVLQEKFTLLSDIKYNHNTEEIYISISTPIYNGNKIVGILKGAYNIENNFFNPTIMNTTLGFTGSTFIVDSKGFLLAHGNNKLIGLHVEEIVVGDLFKGVNDSLSNDNVVFQEFKTLEGIKRVLAATYLLDNFIIGVSYDQAELYEPKVQLEKAFIFLTFLTLIIILIAGLWLNRKISLPFTLLTEQADKIAKGDFSAPLPTKRDKETIYIINALKRVLNEKDRLLIQTIQMISTTLEKRDAYTAGHSRRVTEYALQIANYMNLSKEERSDLELGALLHDIGKVGVPDYVLLKSGKLTNEEFNLIKLHPVYGDDIIKNIDSLNKIRPIVRSHHERWDGRGYPDRLKGTDIHLLARITCVADAFDAMTSDRPYRKGLMETKAVEIIKNEVGKQFDPEVVEAFLKWKLGRR